MADNSETHPRSRSDHRDPVAFRQDDITESAREHSGMSAYDYVDQFVLVTDTAGAGTPQDWARAALEQAAGAKGQFVWRGILRLQLTRRPGVDQVAGWRIADRGATWITLEAQSSLFLGRLVIEVVDRTVSLTTFLRYERRLGECVWGAVSPGHRRFAPVLLTEAQRILPAQP